MPTVPPPPFDTLTMAGLDPWLNARRPLEIPVAPSDPGVVVSLPVTAEPVVPANFATVASLLASQPAILTPVELSCKPLRGIGGGFIIVGDDDGPASIKVCTTAAARPDDRVIRLTGELHSENGTPVTDGSGVPCDPDIYDGPGVLVMAESDVAFYDIGLGDYVSATGVCSIWRGSDGKSYRCVRLCQPWWASGFGIRNYDYGDPSAPNPTATDNIGCDIKVYDLAPGDPPVVTVYCSNGECRLATLSVNGTTGTGNCAFADLTSMYDYSTPVKYIVSAQCEGYKTRTITDVVPGSTVGFYLVPLRKTYVTADDYSLSPCSGSGYPTSTTIRANVVDGRHIAMPNVAVRFKTDKGSFDSNSTLHATTATTDENGNVTVPFYAVPSESGSATIKATDDSAPDAGDDPNADPFNYDWEQVSATDGRPTTIRVWEPSQSLALSPSSVSLGMCDTQQEIAATPTVCGTHRGGESVEFTATLGSFEETGQRIAHAVTDGSGVARVTYLRPNGECGSGQITAKWIGGTVNTSIPITIDGWKLSLQCSRFWTLANIPITIKATVSECDGDPVGPGQSVTLTTDQGHFGNDQTTYTTDTDSNGEVTTTLTIGTCPVTAHVSASTVATQCTSAMTASSTVKVICDEPVPCEIFLCIDCTGSMGSENGGHRATESIAKFLTDMRDAGVILKVGGVKFNEGVGDGDDHMDNGQLSSVGSFRDVDSFITAWVKNGYSPLGGDSPELQLDALDIALEDMNEYSVANNPNRYIVLITDNSFHEDDYDPATGWGSQFTKRAIIDRLEASGCRAHISLWPPWASETTYAGLAVNGGFDQPCTGCDVDQLYPLDNLRHSILSHWPTEYRRT